SLSLSFFSFFNGTATTEIYTLSLHDALPISMRAWSKVVVASIPCTAERPRAIWSTASNNGSLSSWRSRLYASGRPFSVARRPVRSEEHTSELQSRENLVCRLLLEKKKKQQTQ